MIFESKRLSELTESDILALRDGKIMEGKCVEYKRDLPGPSDQDKKEFLFDVSSFANASGGYLIYGIDEEAGIPTGLSHLVLEDADAELLRLQSQILDGIEPRIAGLELRFIPCADSTWVLVIHIPKSWTMPHMVIFKGADKFYTRNSGGKHRLDLNDLRALFSQSSQIAEHIRDFRLERLSRILADELPIPLHSEPKIVLQIIPFQSFAYGTRINLQVADLLPDGLLYPLGAKGYGTRVNLDGLLHHHRGIGDNPAESYLQLFHNGIIETVNAHTLNANAHAEIPQFRTAKLIPSESFEGHLVRQLPKYLIALQKLGLEPPFALMLALIGVKDFCMAVNPGHGGGAKIDRDVLIIPEIIQEKVECKPIDIKPLLDMVWNAAGSFNSPNFDSSGNWTPGR